jgi:AMMECR1 domain-containing protein
LQREVIQAARAASRHDPRYRPLFANDLKGFAVTVTVVQRTLPISVEEIDSLRPEDGLVLQSGERFGIVLPWEGKEPRLRLKGLSQSRCGSGHFRSLIRLQAMRFRG